MLDQHTLKFYLSPRKITSPGDVSAHQIPGIYIYKLLKLSYRNLFRNRRGAAFAITIGAAGFAALSIAMGYYQYIMYGLEELTIRNGFGGEGGSGHVQIKDIHAGLAEESYAYEFGLGNVATLMKALGDDPDVDYILPRIEIGGLISNGDKVLPFKGYGIEPATEARLRNGLSKIDPTALAGNEILPLGREDTGILLGRKLALALHAKVGDALIMYGTTVDGAINGTDVVVSGIMSTGINQVDKYYLLTNIKTAQQLINTDKISYAAVMFKNREHLDEKQQRLSDTLKARLPLAPLRLLDWKQNAEFYTSVEETYSSIFIFMGVIVLLLVALGCWNIMHIATMERVREIGTLRAIGLSVPVINMIFFLEAMFIGVISVLTGFLLHLLIAALINEYRIMMPTIPGMNRGYPLRINGVSIYHLWLSAGIIVAISCSSLSSFLAIRKLSIIDSLEHT